MRHPSEHRPQEHVAVRQAGGWISGHDEDRLPVDVAQGGRLAGFDRNPVEQDFAEGPDDVDDEVPFPRGRPDEYSIIPSVQPTHANSDMYWAIDRLGPERVKGAYAYHDLLQQNGWIPLGTDFPVEDISPFKTFYAAVVRKDAKGWPANGFQTENALSREETLRGMTIWAAKANFEENEKGSLEKGKFADFVILDNDLMKEVPEKLLEIKVMKTFVGGE